MRPAASGRCHRLFWSQGSACEPTALQAPSARAWWSNRILGCSAFNSGQNLRDLALCHRSSFFDKSLRVKTPRISPVQIASGDATTVAQVLQAFALERADAIGDVFVDVEIALVMTTVVVVHATSAPPRSSLRDKRTKQAICRFELSAARVDLFCPLRHACFASATCLL